MIADADADADADVALLLLVLLLKVLLLRGRRIVSFLHLDLHKPTWG